MPASAARKRTSEVVSAAQLLRDLQALRNPERALVSRRFFKTGAGQYGEGDRFLGLTVPMLRALAKRHSQLSLTEASKLLRSTWHEARLLALLIMVRQYASGDAAQQAVLYKLYLANTQCINNWDLVDASAEHIVGHYLQNRVRTPLRRLARSKNLWQRRIAVLATFHYIKQGEFAETLHLAELLMNDTHDLIHKAVGWMLREIGKRDQAVAEAFLSAHAAQMPRTMLRYAIERFTPALRQRYMQR